MNYKEKSWWWAITGPWYNLYITIGNTIYYPEGRPPSEEIIRHEEIHAQQMKNVGMFKFYFLYIFCFPILWNPWRWKWEYEAYIKGSNWTKEDTIKELRSYNYGWLRNND